MNAAIVEYIGGIEVIKRSIRGARPMRNCRAGRGKRCLFLQLDEKLSAANFHLPRGVADDAGDGFAGGLAALPERKSGDGDLYHDDHPFAGNRRAAFSGDEFCRRSGQGGNNGWRGGRYPCSTGAGSWRGNGRPWQMDITLSHVSFGYHQGEEILHDVSLEIPAGSISAMKHGKRRLWKM